MAHDNVLRRLIRKFEQEQRFQARAMEGEKEPDRKEFRRGALMVLNSLLEILQWELDYPSESDREDA